MLEQLLVSESEVATENETEEAPPVRSAEPKACKVVRAGDPCPDCGMTTISDSGCWLCPACGKDGCS